ncbi:tryptophan synthase subunit alpha [Candidatus Marithioploca araucensis]|uniref:Tryptophan synthase alpha chain n=1 Tax=Candidatus Marithioploca araucensis TaxID=70273 RepID=A0ABT7VQP8_9GAMM|nr:tryptophan synthase subunit alpha [Candidatus Marithioploca araucensis]
MNNLKTCFDNLRAQKRTALIPFITAGDPSPTLTVPLMHGLVEAGADVIELGVPFSDPMADGPVIQRASERALSQGTSLRDVLDMVKTFRAQNQTTPIVLMGYLNPIEIMGYETFVQAAESVGVDGVLTVDLPPEEATNFCILLYTHTIAPIFLLAPTTNPERIKQICIQASGYLYYVSLKGVTGDAHLDMTSVAEKVKEIRQYTKLPIGVGFGIKDVESAAQVAKVSDAVIVGSALVKLIETEPQEKLLEIMPAFVRELRQGIDASL